MVKPKGWCSRPSVPSAVGRAAELAAPDDQRVFEQAARLQVVEQAGDRPVGRRAVVRQLGPEAAVLVPELAALGGVIDLHEPHAALDQPPGHQALPAEDVGRGVVEAVEPSGRSGSRRRCRRPRGPASACGTPARTTRSARRAGCRPRGRARCSRLSWLSSVELLALLRRREPRIAEVGDRVLQVGDQRPLVGRRQEARAPERRALRRLARADHDEARAGPGSRCPGRRSATSPGSGREKVCSPVFICRQAPLWLMLSATIERITHRSSTHAATFGNSSLTSMPDCAVPRELERRGEQVAGAGPLQLRHRERQRLAVVAASRAWGRTGRRATARPHEQEDHPLGPGRVVRRPDGQRIGRGSRLATARRPGPRPAGPPGRACRSRWRPCRASGGG